MVPEGAEGVVGGLPGMDDDGQFPLRGQLELAPEDLLLNRARREVVVVVEPDLSECHRVVRAKVGVQPRHRRIEVVSVLTGLVRMDSDREPHLRPRGAHPAGPLPLRGVARRQDHHRAGKARAAGPLDDGVEIGGEFLAGEMAMGVDHWRGTVLKRCRRQEARKGTDELLAALSLDPVAPLTCER